MTRVAVLVVLALAIGGVAGCGDEAPPGAGGTSVDTSQGPTGGAASGDAVQGVGTVLESPDHGPQLCLGGVEDSLPPQCEGVELVGWDWAGVDGSESASGTTWGSYAVTGTWDGTRLTVTKVEAPDAVEEPAAGDQNLTTPCETPEGGWAVIDPATATDEAMQEALGAASAKPDYAGAWLDQSTNPASDGGDEQSDEGAMNDPTKLVLNVMFTGDLEQHEVDLRSVWGGALCVSSAPRSEADLLAIQSELSAEPGILGSAPDPRAGTVEVSVVVDDGLQKRMDDAYGPGVVVVMPSLMPVG